VYFQILVVQSFDPSLNYTMTTHQTSPEFQ